MQLITIRQLNCETQIVVFIYVVFIYVVFSFFRSGLEQGPSLE